ncbi:MAG TPA: hypothetical protein HPP77_01695 [Candidatus Hydrogenedentes bacterium]|nr:hypothetical protein [Candidatus Hydrogenedentota bacterium]
MVLLLTVSVGCPWGGDGSDSDADSDGDGGPPPSTVAYRQEMRDFVEAISAYAKAEAAGFVIIPQNGQEIMTLDGESNGPVASDYIAAIDGIGREDLFYGYDNDDEATPPAERSYLLGFMDLAVLQGLTVLVTDYCSTLPNVDDSYAQNDGRGYVGFAADDRELRTIPSYPTPIHNLNSSAVESLDEAQNFLYLLNSESFGTRQAFLSALDATAYDLFIIDLDAPDGAAFTPAEIAELKTKPNGMRRLVICYMSIGEAEDYRYYWQSAWDTNPPDWIVAENPDWEGNYKVEYWDPAWQAVIFGSEDAYLDRILEAGFDGAYLDIIDAFEYFEEL